MDKILSICIPTYNGGDRLIKLVRRILTSSSDEFEVVVSDNCSTDGTVSGLKSINDTRLVICHKDENVGFFKNAISALKNGQGKYLLLCNDIDIIYPEFIDEYIDFLRCSHYGVILNNGMFKGNNAVKVLTEGQSIFYIFLNSHPSYNVFLKEGFEKIDINDTLIDNGYFNSLLGVEIVGWGYSVALNNKIPIVSATEPSMYMRKSSRSVLGLSKIQKNKVNISYTPQDQMKRFREYYKYIAEYTGLIKDVNIGYLYGVFLELATMNYFSFCMDSVMAHRYPPQNGIWNKSVEDFLSVSDWFFVEAKLFLEKNGGISDSLTTIMQMLSDRMNRIMKNHVKSQTDKEYERNLTEIDDINLKLNEKGICFL